MRRAAKAVVSPVKEYRPAAPIDLDLRGEFRPAPELEAWARATFIEEGALLYNERHAHLEQAHIACLWTNVPNSRHMRGIAGTCELGKPMALGKWAKAKAEWQLRQWFGAEPDFLITIDATYAAVATDLDFCALIEHELGHAGIEQDEFGMPKFRKTGLPAWAIQGHDVEEHVFVVERYGATSEAMRRMHEAMLAGPTIGFADAARACGTCHLKAV